MLSNYSPMNVNIFSNPFTIEVLLKIFSSCVFNFLFPRTLLTISPFWFRLQYYEPNLSVSQWLTLRNNINWQSNIEKKYNGLIDNSIGNVTWHGQKLKQVNGTSRLQRQKIRLCWKKRPCLRGKASRHTFPFLIWGRSRSDNNYISVVSFVAKIELRKKK